MSFQPLPMYLGRHAFIDHGDFPPDMNSRTSGLPLVHCTSNNLRSFSVSIFARSRNLVGARDQRLHFASVAQDEEIGDVSNKKTQRRGFDEHNRFEQPL